MADEKVQFQEAKSILQRIVTHIKEKDIPKAIDLIKQSWRKFWTSEIGEIIKNREKIDTVSMAIQVGFILAIIFILLCVFVRKPIAILLKPVVNKILHSDLDTDDVEILIVGPLMEEAYKTFILELSANEKIAHIMLVFFSIAEYVNKLRKAKQHNQTKIAAVIGLIAVALHHILLKVQHKIRQKLQTTVGKVIAFLTTLGIHILYNYTIKRLSNQ